MMYRPPTLPDHMTSVSEISYTAPCPCGNVEARWFCKNDSDVFDIDCACSPQSALQNTIGGARLAS